MAISSTLISHAVADTAKTSKNTIAMPSQKAMATQLKLAKQAGHVHTLTPDSVIRAEKLHPSANLSYKVKGTRYQPIQKVSNFTQEGKASWYGKQFHGRKTASGERYDMNEMTAAHRTLPSPSYAKVTNLANGKEVIVRINDRGPFHSNRVMDVSFGAAKKLGMVNSGTARVRVEQLVPGQLAQAETAQPMFVSLQKFDQVQDAQAYLQRVNALVSKEQHGKKVSMVREGDKYVVQVGPVQSHEKTEPFKQTMLTAL